MMAGDEVDRGRPGQRSSVKPKSDEFEAQLGALGRDNEQLRQLVEQAIRMGENVLRSAQETVSAYHVASKIKGAVHPGVLPTHRAGP